MRIRAAATLVVGNTTMSSLPTKLLRALVAMKFALAAVFLLSGAAHARAPVDAEQGRVHIEINKAQQRMIVYVDGEERMSFNVSTGTPDRETPRGTFHALSMAPMAISTKYGNTPMPHAIFFTSVGHAIHATQPARP